MALFSDSEIAYLTAQPLGRMATTGADGAPHVVPVGFKYNATLDTIDIIGANLAGSKKARDLQRDPRVAFVVDDVLPPWQPRGIEIRGTATLLLAANIASLRRDTIRLKPEKVIAWGIESDAYQRITKTQPRSEKAEHHPTSPDPDPAIASDPDRVDEASMESFPASDPPAH